MDRPPSIVNFERCYVGSIIVGLIGFAVNTQMRERLATTFQQTDTIVGGWYMPTVLAFSILIPIALWFFAARRASSVAKWIIVVLFALNCLGVASGLAMGTEPGGIAGVLTIISFVLDAVAVWLLFRPDARAWFGEPPLENGRGVAP